MGREFPFYDKLARYWRIFVEDYLRTILAVAVITGIGLLVMHQTGG